MHGPPTTQTPQATQPAARTAPEKAPTMSTLDPAYCAQDAAATRAILHQLAPTRRQRIVRTASGQYLYSRTYSNRQHQPRT